MDLTNMLPPDLAEIDAAAQLNQHSPEDRRALIQRLHAMHVAADKHIEQVTETVKMPLKSTLGKLYRAEGLFTQASFNTVIFQGGPPKIAFEKAKQLLQLASDGLLTLGSGMATRLKNIVNSGKDEQ